MVADLGAAPYRARQVYQALTHGLVTDFAEMTALPRALRAALADVTARVRSEKLGEVAHEFDAVHTIERAQRVGSVDRISPAAELRPYVVDALSRGIARSASR